MKFDQRFLVWVMWNSSGILYFGQDLFVVLNFIPELNYTYFIPEWDFTCKHKFYHPMMSFIPGWDLILVSCKQLPKIEVQVDAKKKTLRPALVAITILLAVTVPAIRVPITMSLVFWGNSSLKGKVYQNSWQKRSLCTFWFPCIYICTL